MPTAPGSPESDVHPLDPIVIGRGATDAGLLLGAEWLLTDGRGGYAMGTALGVPTRRYHGWLVAAATPPVGRTVMLHSAVERVVIGAGTNDERAFDLSTYCFPGTLHPGGHLAFTEFRAGATARWSYALGGSIIAAREIALIRGRADEPAGVVVRYTVKHTGAPCALEIRPMVALRDAHQVLRAASGAERFCVSSAPGMLRLERADGIAGDSGSRLNLRCARGRFVPDAQWWFNVEYPRDRERGQDFTEDIYSPGYFRAESPAAPGLLEVELRAWTGGFSDLPAATLEELRAERDRAHGAIRRAAATAAGRDSPHLRALASASDAFVVRRGAAGAEDGASIIAGYPWFADWGRDTMIALPGLLLCSGRFDEARRVLETFASYERRGLIPNWFDDSSGEAEYNAADAPLWFISAACAFTAASGDASILDGHVGHVCDAIVQAYLEGTEHGIRVESDGLVRAGTATTQLTWMDAKRDGTVFTPRHGKPVELSALWYHALSALAAARSAGHPRRARELVQHSERTAQSFHRAFWSDRLGCLADSLTPDAAAGWKQSGEIRPNQIFAASLRFSPLDQAQRAQVVGAVRARLAVDEGVRTLAPAQPGYIGRFEGSLFERDRAYHNGTAWPWLLGPLAEGVVRAGAFSADARRAARAIIEPLAASLRVPGAGRVLGSAPEVYDGDGSPQRPRNAGGCPAQAWSVGEALRVLVLIERSEAGLDPDGRLAPAR